MVIAMRASLSPAEQPLNPQPGAEEQPVFVYVDVVQEVARNETQQVQKQMSRPELQLVESADEVPVIEQRVRGETHEHTDDYRSGDNVEDVRER